MLEVGDEKKPAGDYVSADRQMNQSSPRQGNALSHSEGEQNRDRRDRPEQTQASVESPEDDVAAHDNHDADSETDRTRERLGT